jgi:hypothetical protein
VLMCLQDPVLYEGGSGVQVSLLLLLLLCPPRALCTNASRFHMFVRCDSIHASGWLCAWMPKQA